MFALHHTESLIVSGDLDGMVCFSNYVTGEIGGSLGQHAQSVEAIAVCKAPELALVVSCAMETNINIYDIKL